MRETCNADINNHGIAELNTGLTTKQSVVLLVSRVLMTSLFIWAGQAEIKRQLASVHSDGMGHQV